MRTLLGIVVAVILAVGLSAQEQATPQQQIQQLQQALAVKTNDLGQCNAERGGLQQLQAQVISGQWVTKDQAKAEADQAVAKYKADIERANGKTVGADLKLADAPPAPAKK